MLFIIAPTGSLSRQQIYRKTVLKIIWKQAFMKTTQYQTEHTLCEPGLWSRSRGVGKSEGFST